MAAKTCLKTTGAIILLLVLVVTSAAVQADIIYVDTDATGNDDGTSWTDAYNYLQDALIDDAGSGDEIWVAEGTYYPDEGDTPINDDRTETFELVDGVGIYGGFDATETSRSQRDWVNNVTILSGDIGTADVNTDNSYHVVTGCADVNATMVLDGFTITKGYADGSGADEHGGGINANNLTCPTISNCTITDNYANGIGGGIIAWNVPDRTISNCTINQNYALSGAGIAIAYCDANITNCTISDNEATGFGGGIRFSVCDPDIRDCIITDNKSTGFGGGGLAVSNSGLGFTPGIPKVSNCAFAGNDANDSYGGVLYTYRSELIIENCLIYNNDTSAVCNSIASPNITNCTIVANEGGIENLLSIFPLDPGVSSPKITNCILWNNTNEVTNESGCNPNISYSDVENCYDSNGVWDPNLGTDGGGNIDEDPCFVDAGANDFHLDDDSPCINAGDPDGDYTGQTDMDGDPRVMRGRIDMGADEFPRVHNITQDKWYIAIQSAIDDANNGDEIVAYPGTYYETVDFSGVACTVRSADPNDDDVVAETIIDANSDANNPGRVVTFDTGEDANSVLTGFTITGGYVSYPLDGAGIYCYGSSPTISRCIIYDNDAGDDGGGISCDNSSSPSISYCLISDNEAGDGAGICCNNSSSPTISYCDIIDNDADDKGGGIYCKANSIPTIKDCEISSNSAYKGGGIYCSTDVQIERCIVSENQTIGTGTSPDGGGIYCLSSSPNILNCIINDNFSDDDGGGIWCDNGSDPNIINCTLTQNEADDKGGGIYCRDSDPVIKNCILWDDTASTSDEIHTSSSSPVVSYSDVEGGWSGPYNINSDPCFVNPDVNDFHLDWDSPCINAGDPNGDYNDLTDIDGQPRVIGSRVDIGADERASVYNIDQNKWYIAIQAAIDDANDDDDIVVYPGVYYETIDFSGVACTVRSTDPNDDDVVESTIIDANCDANNTGRVVTFDSGEDANSVLSGFTITGGYANGSSPLDYCGGGIYCYNASSPTINRCIIIDNKAGVYGGGMYNYYWACPTVTNCIFVNNSTVGNGVYGGYGGGISNLTYSTVTLINCTFSKNSAYIDNGNGGYGGAMINILSSPKVTNCIFWDDHADYVDNEVHNTIGSDPNFSYCDIEGCGGSGGWDPNFGTDGGGNIDSDPLFNDPNNDDLHLDSNSPCIDVGYPDGDYTGQTDIDGEPRVMRGRVDMGADEFPIIAYWTMDDNAASTTVLDNIGNANNGTFYDATGDPNTSAHHETGKVGGALSFDGVDDYILVSDSNSISVGNSDYTICAWIYPDSVSGLQGIVTKVKDGSDKEYAFSIGESAIRLDVEKDGNNGYASTASGVVTVSSWQHVAVSFDSSGKISTFYYNGQKQATTIDTIDDLPDQFDDDLYIGMFGGIYNDYEFDGKIDDVMIFSMVLTEAEISELAN